MEVKSKKSWERNGNDAIIIEEEEEEEEGALPGFRFHPTDEELVSFYLKRKVEKRKPLSIEIIKQIDIYKHDPWDLAKGSSSIGEKEWYFYCKRGRKYRNSIRPNRVTGSGFWKATGIDRPIYSNGGEGRDSACIGLKKSLVYYRGSAGKGTKTDWMMHEFRLPTHHHHHHHPSSTSTSPSNPTPLDEAEIWTLCRIFKRNKRHTPDWRELSSRKTSTAANSSSKTSSIDSNPNQECYINFATHQIQTPINNINHNHANYYNTINNNKNNNDIIIDSNNNNNNNIARKQDTSHNNICTGDQKNLHANHQQQQWNSMAHTPQSHLNMLNHVLTTDHNDLQCFGYYGHNWDDLNSVVEFAVNKPF